MQDKDLVTIILEGRIDSNNASKVEESIHEKLSGKEPAKVVIDAEKLEYISSAGLRVILRIKKTNPDLTICNVSTDVYEIFDKTGFTEMMKVERAYRKVSIEGCEVVGKGANGTVYRIDADTVVKVYNNPDAIEDIRHEREVAKLALILGIPTAISYDVVRIGDSYGAVFELLNATNFSKILNSRPEKFDWCVKEFAGLLKTIHATKVPEGKLPEIRNKVIHWVKFVQEYIPKEAGDKLMKMVEAVPEDDHLIHGDYHTKNVMLQGDEVLLIDMDTLAVGNPIFELASVFNSLVGYSEYNHDTLIDFQGYDYATGLKFWHDSLAAYLDTRCEAKIREVADKARIIGYTRMIRRTIRRKGLETEELRSEIELWKKELLALLEKVDDLTFHINELNVEADVKYLEDVQFFIEEKLQAVGCPPKALMQINVAAEEIFVNIANYAYHPERGRATVRVEITEEPGVVLTFLDKGVPYDPLSRSDPDVSLPAEERDIGGLGIFITKKFMDDVNYEYKDGQNILTLKKAL